MTVWKVILTCTPIAGSQRTCIPIPCQSASNKRWGFKREAIPERPLQGSNFRKGVRFSVQTCSDARDACRRWWGMPQSGRLPSGAKGMTGDVVRCSSRVPSDAQNNPASAFRNPDQRASMLRCISTVQDIEEGKRTYLVLHLPSMSIETRRFQHLARWDSPIYHSPIYRR